MSILSIIPSLIDLGSELIEDKDKRNEYAFKLAELGLDIEKANLTQKTTPKVDAIVKLIYAIKPLIRPIGGALMTAFGAYCHYKQIPIDPVIHGIFDGALPAYGVSRHTEKAKRAKKKDYFDDEDND